MSKSDKRKLQVLKKKFDRLAAQLITVDSGSQSQDPERQSSSEPSVEYTPIDSTPMESSGPSIESSPEPSKESESKDENEAQDVNASDVVLRMPG